MKPTNVNNPDYYHKVVDCQWACPAHTDVPEYIRKIAQGEFTDAYIQNRESNIFPGILGRVCDRPCEPACRRGRTNEKPVAICRLKRVAADHRDEDISDRLPIIPKQKKSDANAVLERICLRALSFKEERLRTGKMMYWCHSFFVKDALIYILIILIRMKFTQL